MSRNQNKPAHYLCSRETENMASVFRTWTPSGVSIVEQPLRCWLSLNLLSSNYFLFVAFSSSDLLCLAVRRLDSPHMQWVMGGVIYWQVVCPYNIIRPLKLIGWSFHSPVAARDDGPFSNFSPNHFIIWQYNKKTFQNRITIRSFKYLCFILPGKQRRNFWFNSCFKNTFTILFMDFFPQKSETVTIFPFNVSERGRFSRPSSLRQSSLSLGLSEGHPEHPPSPFSVVL